MFKRLLSASVMGILALGSVPAFAEESSSSSSSSAASTSSVVSSAASSSESSLNHGQQIKANCAGLIGKDRVDCIRKQSKPELNRKLMKVKKVIKKAVKENCSEYEKGSDESKACAKSQKSSVMSKVKETYPRASDALKKIRSRHNEIEDESSSSSSSSAS